MRIVDLSATIDPSSPESHPFDRRVIDYVSHAEGAAQIEAMFRLPASLLRDGEGWAIETLAMMTHNATHVDAPWHYNSHIDGQPALTVDELPLEWFYSDGVVLDMAWKEEGAAVTTAEAQAELSRIGCQLKPLDIVLVRTGRDRFYGQPDYPNRGCGVTAGATRWFYDQGVRVMGIDAWSWDAPLHMQAEAALAARQPGIFWAAHQAGLSYCQIERLVNLQALPPLGFTVACFPLKIHRGSAGPARAVAILPE
jgi:kynurenine formamidase